MRSCDRYTGELRAARIEIGKQMEAAKTASARVIEMEGEYSCSSCAAGRTAKFRLFVQSSIVAAVFYFSKRDACAGITEAAVARAEELRAALDRHQAQSEVALASAEVTTLRVES